MMAADGIIEAAMVRMITLRGLMSGKSEMAPPTILPTVLLIPPTDIKNAAFPSLTP